MCSLIVSTNSSIKKKKKKCNYKLYLMLLARTNRTVTVKQYLSMLIVKKCKAWLIRGDQRAFGLAPSRLRHKINQSKVVLMVSAATV